ncbi:MAG TPA: type VI secretion system baseplate subunit TssF, partial [Candidatus Eisenbacteria bacterium]
FTFPQKFLFVEISGLARLAELGGEDQFDIVLRLDRPPTNALRLSPDNFLLGCAPAINLFEKDGDPITVEHDKTEYLVRASGRDPGHYEIFSVDRVRGIVPGTAEPREYPSFLSYIQSPGSGAAGSVYHGVRLKPAVVADGTDSWLSFHAAPGDPALPDTETISVSLTCTNRRLARSLRIGDVSVATTTSPGFAQFRNIGSVTTSLPPPLGGDLHWRLISHLALSQQGMSTVEALRTVLSLYNFQAMHDRQAARENELRLAGIRSLRAEPADAVIGGAVARGRHTILELDETNFSGPGDLVLFASVLDEFLAQYASLNHVSRLTVKTTGSGEEYAWKPRFGRRTTL